MGIVVKRPVRVMVVATHEYKERRTLEIRAALAKLDAVRKRIATQLESARESGEAGAGKQIAQRLSVELGRNEQARAALAGELEKISSLETGAEYERGTLEGSVEVEVGDDFSKLGECEIVVKDNIIVEIRDGLCKTM